MTKLNDSKASFSHGCYLADMNPTLENIFNYDFKYKSAPHRAIFTQQEFAFCTSQCNQSVLALRDESIAMCSRYETSGESYHPFWREMGDYGRSSPTECLKIREDLQNSDSFTILVIKRVSIPVSRSATKYERPRDIKKKNRMINRCFLVP